MNKAQTHASIVKTAYEAYRQQLADDAAKAKEDGKRVTSTTIPALEDANAHHQNVWDQDVAFAIANPSATSEEQHAASVEIAKTIAQRRGTEVPNFASFDELSDNQKLRYDIIRQVVETNREKLETAPVGDEQDSLQTPGETLSAVRGTEVPVPSDTPLPEQPPTDDHQHGEPAVEKPSEDTPTNADIAADEQSDSGLLGPDEEPVSTGGRKKGKK